MDRLTALIIKNRGDDIKCEFGGPAKTNGKYVGWIILYKNEHYDHPLLNTEAIYDSPEEAVSEMKKIVNAVRKLSLEEIMK